MFCSWFIIYTYIEMNGMKINCNLCVVLFVCLNFAVFLRKSPNDHHLHMFICSNNSNILRSHNRWCINKCATRCTVAMDIRHLFIRSVKRVQYETVTYSNGHEHKMRKFISINSFLLLCGFFLFFSHLFCTDLRRKLFCIQYIYLSRIIKTVNYICFLIAANGT